MESLFWILATLFVVCTGLTVCGIVADHVLPHVKWINKFLESLPLAHDEDE